MFYLIFPPGLWSQTATTSLAQLNGLNFPSFVSDSSETKLCWNFVQRIHKKSETQFETIEFIRREGEQGKVASQLCSLAEQKIVHKILIFLHSLKEREIDMRGWSLTGSRDPQTFSCFYWKTSLRTFPRYKNRPAHQFLLWKFCIDKLYRDILCGLAVVLQDDCDVHVDDNKEADDQVGEQEGDGHDGVAAVTLISRLRISWKTNRWEWELFIIYNWEKTKETF